MSAPLAAVPAVPVPATMTGTRSCDGTMTCSCELCELEREHRVKRGIRPRTPLPTRIAA